MTNCNWKDEKMQFCIKYKSKFEHEVILIFSRIRTEYGKIRKISPYLDRMRENTDQNNAEYGHFLRCVYRELCYISSHYILFRLSEMEFDLFTDLA